MKPVRMAVVGLGHAGMRYSELLEAGEVRGAVLSAVCSSHPEKMARFPPSIARFATLPDMLEAQAADAVIIATPHADHVPSGIAALEAGWHVLVEKPLAVRLSEARRLVEAHRCRQRQVLAVMLNLRSVAAYRQIAEMVRAGDLGPVRRVHWTFTEWYRTQAYFKSSWRGTWKGEGGGLLINQMVHHVDLLQWWFGRPSTVGARAMYGKYHEIEVEDEVFAWWQYADGLMISMAFSTGEAPGFNHLEIVGDRRTLAINGHEMVEHRLAVPLSEHRATCAAPDAKPPWRSKRYRLDTSGSSHAALIQNFVAAIRDGAPLLAPAEHGLASLEIVNAMQLSTWMGNEVTLPLDTEAFDQAFNKVSQGNTEL